MVAELLEADRLPEDFYETRTTDKYRFHILDDIAKCGSPSKELSQPSPIEIDELYNANQRAALYVHVPWCVETCTYCYYWGKVQGRPEMRALLDAEVAHANSMDKRIGLANYHVPSIYFGGGTPTVLPADLLGDLLGHFHSRYASGETEFCVEASISSLSDAKISVLQRYADRISIGIQSFDNELLKRVARSFDADKAKRMLTELVPKFRSINIDLIFGLQYQTLRQWLSTIEDAIMLGVQSITLYRLEIRTAHHLATYKRDPASFPTEPQCQEYRRQAVKLLEEAGYHENLIGWFLRSDEIDTKVYRERWQEQTPCIAFGNGGHNYGGQYIYYTIQDAVKYAAEINKGNSGVDKCTLMSPQQQLLWFTFAQWKSGVSVPIKVLYEKYPANLVDSFIKAAKTKLDQRLLRRSGDEILVTELGKPVLEWILRDLLTWSPTIT